jgi:hypothetical protein
MDQEESIQQTPVNRANANVGCRHWIILLVCILLAPIVLFFGQLFYRWVVIPWIDDITVRMNRDLVDQSFVTNAPCEAPCWYTLNLGISTESDVRKTLEQLPFVDQDSILERDSAWINENDAKRIFYDCSYLKDEMCGGFILSEGILKQIYTRVDYPLTFETVVEKIGPPNFYNMIHGIEFQNCTINLFWLMSDVEVMISNYQHFNCPVGTGIGPDFKVDWITYSLDNKPWKFERYSNVYHPWQGFSKP